MAKLQKKTGGNTTTDGMKKPMDKIHVGFDVKTGIDGYDSIKSIVRDLRASNFNVNDRKLIISLAGETDKKYDNALAIVESGFIAVEELIKEKSIDEIVGLITGE